MIDKVKDYVIGCNIDIEVALEDLGLEPKSVTEGAMNKAGYRRCDACDCWFNAKGYVCKECIEIARRAQA